MTCTLKMGPRDWRLTRDDKGYREYKLKLLVLCGPRDGPGNALLTPGLPYPGAMWIVDDEFDPWVWCRPNVSVVPLTTNEPNRQFELEFTFSNKPLDRCHGVPVENPLLQPMKIGGSFQRYTQEATHDMFGLPIITSSHEPFRGPQVEFDKSRQTVHIQQNVPVLGDDVFGPMVDTVNDSVLWGRPPRTIKLSNVPWDEHYYGLCEKYFTRTLQFEIRAEGFDRELQDAGTMALRGHWDEGTGLWALEDIDGAPPDRMNPAHFNRFKDWNGENSRVVLDGRGQPFNRTFVAPVTTCEECPPSFTSNGAPSAWRVLSMDLDAGVVDVDLVYQVNCHWEDVTGDVILDFTSFGNDDDEWVLRKVSTQGEWRLDRRLWKPQGPNAMNNASNALDNPKTITVVSNTKPGAVSVKKYPQSNFYLLGIPLILGY